MQDPQSGHPGHLSVEQAHVLEKVRPVPRRTTTSRRLCSGSLKLTPCFDSQFKVELTAAGHYDPLQHDDASLLFVLSSLVIKHDRIQLPPTNPLLRVTVEGDDRRFLRARKFDLVKAKTMWIDTQNWKKSFKVDELYDTFEYSEKKEVDKLYPRSVTSPCCWRL